MGSFATSLHVKTADADRVAAALAELLAEDGWQPTTSPFEAQAAWGTVRVRGLQIAAAQGGWVSVLDSDLELSHAVVPRLAKLLHAPVVFCFVNDSDSWGYRLADAEGAISEFDSADDAEQAGDEGDHENQLVNVSAALGQLGALMRDGSLLQQVEAVRARMMDTAPADVRTAEERLRAGRGTPADMRQYQSWAIDELPKHITDMRALLGGVLGAASSRPTGPQSDPPQRPQSGAHYNALRAILAPGVTPQQVEEVCRREAVFAEEVLGAFLQLLGITDFYAHLSYHYLDESGPEELAAYRIRFVHHLRFELPRPHQAAAR